MKIIHKYVIREFVETFIFGLAVFSIILLLDQIFQLINLFLSKGVPFFTVFKLFLLVYPNILSLAVPMAVLFGILLAYGRLSEDNEITALRSTGIHYVSFTGPVVILIAVLSIFLIFFNQFLSPMAHKNFRQLYQEVLSQRPMIRFEEKTITNVGEYRFYADRVEKNTGFLRGVNIYKFANQEAGAPFRISAASAKVFVNPVGVVFELYNGHWQKTNPAKPDTLVDLDFVKYDFTIAFGGKIIPFSQSLREMTSPELRKEILDYKARKLPISFFENEFWLRWVLALAPLAFALVAVPLGLITERGGKSLGFGLSLGVILVYYILLVSALNLGEKDILPAKFVLWAPNIAMIAASIFFWKRMAAR